MNQFIFKPKLGDINAYLSSYDGFTAIFLGYQPFPLPSVKDYFLAIVHDDRGFENFNIDNFVTCGEADVL